MLRRARKTATDAPGVQFGPVADFYDELMRRIPYRSWVDYVEGLLEKHGARPRTVLDLACGTGRVGSEMARRGYRVWGVDLSEAMARHCARRDPPLPAAVMDATRLGLRAESLDLVVCLYDSLNYILDPEGLQRCFVEVACALRPEGLFIFDLNAPHALRSGLFTQDNLKTNEPLLYSWVAQWDERAGVCTVQMEFTWRGEGGPRRFTETHRQRAYECDAVCLMLATAGLERVTVYNAYTDRPAHQWSDRIFFVAGR